jgi:hypothetical protein
MWKRALIMLISAAMLIVSGAEAMSGHCAKAAEAAPVPMMSAHCAEMMGMELPAEPEQNSDKDAGTCCCVIMAAPVLLHLPMLNDRESVHPAWQRPANSHGPSAPGKVAIPPPRD